MIVGPHNNNSSPFFEKSSINEMSFKLSKTKKSKKESTKVRLNKSHVDGSKPCPSFEYTEVFVWGDDTCG